MESQQIEKQNFIDDISQQYKSDDPYEEILQNFIDSPTQYEHAMNSIPKLSQIASESKQQQNQYQIKQFQNNNISSMIDQHQNQQQQQQQYASQLEHHLSNTQRIRDAYAETAQRILHNQNHAFQPSEQLQFEQFRDQFPLQLLQFNSFLMLTLQQSPSFMLDNVEVLKRERNEIYNKLLMINQNFQVQMPELQSAFINIVQILDGFIANAMKHFAQQQSHHQLHQLQMKHYQTSVQQQISTNANGLKNSTHQNIINNQRQQINPNTSNGQNQQMCIDQMGFGGFLELLRINAEENIAISFIDEKGAFVLMDKILCKQLFEFKCGKTSIQPKDTENVDENANVDQNKIINQSKENKITNKDTVNEAPLLFRKTLFQLMIPLSLNLFYYKYPHGLFSKQPNKQQNQPHQQHAIMETVQETIVIYSESVKKKFQKHLNHAYNAKSQMKAGQNAFSLNSKFQAPKKKSSLDKYNDKLISKNARHIISSDQNNDGNKQKMVDNCNGNNQHAFMYRYLKAIQCKFTKIEIQISRKSLEKLQAHMHINQENAFIKEVLIDNDDKMVHSKPLVLVQSRYTQNAPKHNYELMRNDKKIIKWEKQFKNKMEKVNNEKFIGE